MKSLIIGKGQVGSALYENVRYHHNTTVRDIEPLDCPNVEVLHLCYPDSESFVDSAKAYIAQYKPILTIIHSSVAVGTTEKVGSDVVYSPTRGRHPNLASEMRSFVKCVGGRNPATVSMAQEYLKKCGFQTLTSDNPASLEFFKLISNVHMGLEIAWRQEVERMIQKFGLDPVEYEAWETTYRDGYLRLKDHNLIRSVMKPDPIGGHCILPCTEILSAQFDSPVLKFILDSNEKRKAELA